MRGATSSFALSSWLDRSILIDQVVRWLKYGGAAALACVLPACQGDIGGAGVGGAPPPPDVAPQQVPEQPELVVGEGFCVPLEGAEHLASASPEGHAWLLSSSGSTTQIRVLDAFDSSAALVDQVELSNVQTLVAWSDMDAAVLADDGVWRLEALARVQLAPPEGFAMPAALCGDPGTNGALLASGTLFERRDDELWWGWDPGVIGEAVPTGLLRLEGDCQGTDDVTWMTSPDGTLWQVEPAQVFRPVRFESLVAGAATTRRAADTALPTTMLAMLESDQLWVGPEPWELWTFPGGAPSEVQASGGVLWMVSGGQLLRYDGVVWQEVSHELGAIEAMAAHPTGIWLEGTTDVCHVATSTMLRVQGIRPHARSKELDYPFSVLASDPGATVVAALDGEDVPLTADPETGWLEGKARLDDVGWHELVLTAGAANRSLVVKRLPDVVRSWAEDVEPIYAANCTGADCHQLGGSTTGAPDLSTYEAWTVHADEIRLRVVDAQNMPPASSQGPDWGDEQVAIIAQWLEGGMLP